MHEFTVDVGSARLAGSELGSGPRDLLFLHAGVADRRSWLSVMHALQDDARCIAYDQRGHGDTTYSEAGYSATDDALAVLRDRAVDSAVLVGASRGGQVALDLALTAPEQVSALMLIGSAPGDAPGSEPEGEILELFGQIEAAETSGDMQALNEFEARLWLDGPLAEPGRAAGEVRDLFLDMNGRAMTAKPTGQMAAFRPTWDALASLDIPVAVVVGELDLPGLIAAAKATAERIPKARFRTLRTTAHLPMLEQPTVIADEIRVLLER